MDLHASIVLDSPCPIRNKSSLYSNDNIIKNENLGPATAHYTPQNVTKLHILRIDNIFVITFKMKVTFLVLLFQKKKKMNFLEWPILVLRPNLWHLKSHSPQLNNMKKPLNNLIVFT